MGARTGLNLALLAVVAALAALAVWGPEAGRDEHPPARPLLNLDASAVTRLRIEQQGQPPIELERDGERWRMTAPYSVAANPVRVQRVLRLVQTPSLADYPAPGPKAADFGLAAPKLRVVLNDTVDLRFGDREPVSERRYVQVGNRLHLIADTLYYLLQDRPAGYVTPRLLPQGLRPSGFDLPGMQLRRDDGRWRSKPAGALDSADAAVLLAERWSRAQGVDVRPYRSNRLKPEIAIRFDDHPPLRFELLREDDAIRFGRADLGLAWTLPAEAGQALLRPQPAEPATMGRD